MKWKYMASLGAYGWCYNAWPTQCNVSRERSTLRVSLSSFLPHDKRLWNSYLCNNAIGFDNSRCMWKLVVYRGATLYPLCHRANHGAKVWVLYREEFQRPLVGSRDEPKSNYSDVIMDAIISQITSLTIVYSTVYSDADQRKHQSSASLAFVRGIHRGFPRTNGQ